VQRHLPVLQAKTTQGLIALAKAKPGALNYASAGNGSSLHLAAAIFKHATNTNIVPVPYKGANAAIVDMMAGQVQMIVTTMAAALPHVRAGKVRALGTSGRSRGTVLPKSRLSRKPCRGLRYPTGRESLCWQNAANNCP
jgi:tripartite-type tricarboxylate transporter receptor subunit TctC